MLDGDGQPLSCARYHDGYVWTHPDLNITFTWNTGMTPPLLLIPDGYEARVTENVDTILGSIQGSDSPAPDGTSDSTGSELVEENAPAETTLPVPQEEIFTPAAEEAPIEEVPAPIEEEGITASEEPVVATPEEPSSVEEALPAEESIVPSEQ